MQWMYTCLTDTERTAIHNASIDVLRSTGMKIGSEELLTGLEKKGAGVDSSTGTVLFPGSLVEEAIENNRNLIRNGKKLHLLNGVTSQRVEGNRISAKFGGGCEKYLDWDSQELLEPDARGLVRHIRLGEMLNEVGFVGNTVVMKRDDKGKLLDERIRRVRTAALIARHTRKPGSMEVWDIREIDFLVDLGIIARGKESNYKDNPCFVTAKETISPLFLDTNAGEILLELAKRGLPCTVIPMPISGLSAPVTPFGNAVICNAEILGVITAIQSICPEAPVGGGSISGIMDMKNGRVSFSAPEAILQDLAVAEVHERLYGLNYLIGSGYTDSRFPDSQLLAEKTMKYLFTCLSGRYSYPLGLLESGSIFSEEQALVDLELCRYIHGHFRDIAAASPMEETVDLIRKAGIRGSFISETHTLDHFRENWLREILDTAGSGSIDENQKTGIYTRAHEKVQDLLSGADFWEIDKDSRKDLEKVTEQAERILCG